MTYRERYKQCNTIDRLQEMALEDTRVAVLLGSNPDRIKAIENAMNERANEIEANKYEQLSLFDLPGINSNNDLYEKVVD